MEGGRAVPDRPGRRFRGLSAPERRALRREQLVQAGITTFGARGFHATGVRDICTAAGLTERYFYESFHNREALFAAVFDHCVGLIRAGMQQVMTESAHLGALETARLSMRQYLETLRDTPGIVRILLVDATGIDADMGRRTFDATGSFTDLIVPTLQSAFPGLDRGGVDAQSVADGLVGSTLFIVTQWAQRGFEKPLEDVLAACMFFYTAVHGALDQPAGT